MERSAILAGMCLIGIMMLKAGLCTAQEPAPPTRAELAQALQAVHGEVYAALERVPARGWADENVWRPFYALQGQFRGSGGDAARLAEEAPGQYATILQGYLHRLHVEPAGTVKVAADGSIGVSPEQLTLRAYDGVPTALVLRVEPSATAGTLAAADLQADGVKLDGQKVKLNRAFEELLVLPITASRSADKAKLSLTLSLDGRSATVPVALDVEPAGTLHGAVTLAGGDETLTAKLFVEGPAGRLYVLPNARNFRTQNWYAPWQPRFSYVRRFEMALPPGSYRVTAMKGFGYLDWTGTVEVKPGESANVAIQMTRLAPLASDGWYCGDMHIHGDTTLTMLRAEDINVATQTHYSSNKPMKLPTYPDESDPTHLTVSNQEIEHWDFGNPFFFNIPTTVQDPPTGKPEMTPLFYYDKQAHKMGGLTFRWLRGRTFRLGPNASQSQPELAVDAALGYMDVWNVLDNSMQQLLDDPARKWNGNGWGGSLYANTYQTWYNLMNCGLRIPIAAGTSYGRLSRLGFNRVYAKVDGPLSIQSWADALKRGDGFVTNGPLLWLKANGKWPGAGVNLAKPGSVELSVELASRYPVDLVEILENGKVIASRKPTGTPARLQWTQTVQVDKPAWFAARCFGQYQPRYAQMGPHNPFAHTNAVFVTIAGKKPHSAASAAGFIKEIDALVNYADNIPNAQLRTEALQAYRNARAFYAAQTQE